jgi:hypothetical protein
VTELKLKIMLRACKIRVANGEPLEDVLSAYAALTDNDKAYIREHIE